MTDITQHHINLRQCAAK